MATKNIQSRLNNRAQRFMGLVALVMMMVWMMPVMAQTPDYSGTYYIATVGYDGNPANTNNFYLCPSEDWIYYKPTDDWSEDGTTYPNPFLTSFKCKTNAYHSGNASGAVWIIQKHPTEDFYYIKHKSDSKYIVSNGQIEGTTNANRIRVHLEAVSENNLDDKALFSITPYPTNNPTYLVISPKSSDGWNGDNYKWYTVNGGNQNYLYGKGKDGGPAGHTETGGILGLYTQNDANAKFYLEDYITRPTITYNSSNLIEITTVQTGVDLIYTTDGSTPSTTNPNAITISGTPGNITTTSFDPADDVTTIKAVAIVNGEASNVATYYTPVLCGTNHSRLIQSQNNAWNSTDFHFYMIPGDEASGVLKVNTTSLFRPSMKWYFLGAGVENGVQYYYIVNNANSKYLCYDDTNKVYMDNFGNGGNKFKFRIVESPTAGTFNIIPYGLNRFLNKTSSNVSDAAVNVHSSNTDFNSRWKFVLPSQLDKNDPFTPSDPSTNSYSYFKIASVGSNGYYIVPPTGTATNVTTSNSTNASMNWYFEVAQEESDSDWLTYYYIRNAVTGDYLYYTKNPEGDNAYNVDPKACLVMHSSIESGSEDRYMFSWARTATDGKYYIVPKLIKDVSQNKISTLQRNNGTLQSNITREAGNYAWTFPESTYTCAQPTISYEATENGYVITSTESDAKIYYTTDGTDPTPSPGTLYTGAIDVANWPDPLVTTLTIRAIAARNGDGTDASTVASKTVNRVETPVITPLTDGTVEITCATDEAIIYYAMGITQPTSVPIDDDHRYNGHIEEASGKYITAIAVKGGWINSALETSGQITFACANPVIRKTNATTITIECSFPSGATIYYTMGEDPGDPTTSSAHISSGQSITDVTFPITVKAFAAKASYDNSEIVTRFIQDDLSMDVDGYYIIASDNDYIKFVTMVNGNPENAGEKYKITNDISAAGTDAITIPFTGELKGVAKDDGSIPVVSGLSHAIFNTVSGGVVKNIILESVSINGSGNVGAIANEMTGTSSGIASIYNCGILSGSVGGSNHVGGIVGNLGSDSDDDCYARVINCYSYATITRGNDVGGIVGYNNYASNANNIRTMVMNCMFYGDITGGTNVSPVYGGENINNLNDGGLNTFNYYAYDELKTKTITDGKYNCALAVEKKYLNRFEFYRLLLNSNKKLAAFYATGSVDDARQMAKWVLETADRTIDNPKPYPVLKAQGYYPSIINPDIVNAPDSATVGRNKGGKLGKTLAVTISNTKTDGGQTWPADARITTPSLTLQRTDKDFDRFNFNYDKVQLPYYNDVGMGNYTGNRVVTGWKITAITAIDGDPYTASNYPTTGIKDYPDHNYADRKSSNKDLYTVSKRVFSQGAYFDVPYGVTSITIEPYWAKAVYIADPNYDVVYKTDYKNENKQNVTQTGTQLVPDGATPTTFNGQKAETSIERALNYIANTTPGSGLGGLGPTVYDNALVLMGNLHLATVPQNGTNPFTMMSMDMDNDHEPDYSLIYHHISRSSIAPIRFDFLNIPGTAQAQKPNGASLICNFTIFKTRGWFETTNTALFYTSQVEYENLDNNTKTDAPLILLGGVIDQFVSTQSSAVEGKTIYIHVGGNVWINEFGMGTHSDGAKSTPHVPVSVTGGEFPGFYLTGTYKADADVSSDNAECYISGGYIKEAAGASLEQIDGNVRWQIYNADIDNFFGGGINDAKPIKGNVTVDIYNSHVTTYCGGPKFGNMQEEKMVTTNAEGCVFGTYFGAGFGGTSLAKKKYYDLTTYDWDELEGYYITDRGNYFDGITTPSSYVSGKDYGKKGPGVATDFDYEFFVWSSGSTGARFYVKFAAFSLAQCNDVESKLKKCTIENNFYGGGSLGKVVGKVISELDGCTVKGNVFGAGFSASLPTLQVRDAGFTKDPNFNQNSGMFEPGEFSGTTTFEWKNAEEAHVTLEDGESGSDLTNHYIYTDVNLDKSNLGSVSGSVYLTLKGNTVVGTLNSDGSLQENTGNVYGGGDESHVIGDSNTTVILEGNTHVLGNVYGGGNEGPVGGDSKVEIKNE